MSATVFVVDVEPAISSTLALILNSTGYAATSFINPLEALDATSENPPDILITDVVMPQMTGIELAIRFATLHPDCKVLLFSGQTTTVDLLADAEAAGHRFRILAKPVHPTEVLSLLKDLTNNSNAG